MKSETNLPPHSHEAEEGVLGCILIDPNENIPAAAESLSPDDFYDLRNREIFSILIDMHDKGKPVEMPSVIHQLKSMDKLAFVGGIQRLSALPDKAPASSSLDYYIQIVRQKSMLRRISKTCIKIAGEVNDVRDGDDPDELLDRFESMMLGVRNDQERHGKTIRDYIDEAITNIESYSQSEGTQSNRLMTGIYDLDRTMQGMNPGDYIIIAARPSVGKTSLAMQIIEYISLDCREPCAMFSFEMDGAALIERAFYSRTRVSGSAVRSGVITESESRRLLSAPPMFARAPLHIVDEPMNVMQFKAKSRRLVHKHGVKLIVLDYLQLMESCRRRDESRQEEVSGWSRAIKSLARELSVPIIALSQLNREIDREHGRRPKLSDLRESGSLEQDADKVLLLWPHISENSDDREPTHTTVIVAKHRNGPTGDVELMFIPEYTRFVMKTTEQQERLAV